MRLINSRSQKVKVIKAVRELTGWDSRRQKPLQMLHLMCYMRSETRLRLCIIYALSCRIFPNRRSGWERLNTNIGFWWPAIVWSSISERMKDRHMIKSKKGYKISVLLSIVCWLTFIWLRTFTYMASYDEGTGAYSFLIFAVITLLGTFFYWSLLKPAETAVGFRIIFIMNPRTI